MNKKIIACLFSLFSTTLFCAEELSEDQMDVSKKLQSNWKKKQILRGSWSDSDISLKSKRLLKRKRELSIEQGDDQEMECGGHQEKRQNRAQDNDGDENMGVFSDNYSADMKESMDTGTDDQFGGINSLRKKENGREEELKQASEHFNELSDQIKQKKNLEVATEFLAILWGQVKELLPCWSKIELSHGIDTVIFSNMLEQTGQKEVGEELRKIGTHISFWEVRVKNVQNTIKKILKD